MPGICACTARMKLYCFCSFFEAPTPASVVTSVAPDDMRSMMRSLNFCASAPSAMARDSSPGLSHLP